MRLLRKVMVILYKGIPHPKKKNVDMGTKRKTGANYGTHVCSSSTIHIMSLLKATRRFRDKIEWVRTYGYYKMVIRSCKVQTDVKSNLYAILDPKFPLMMLAISLGLPYVKL